MSVEEVQTSDKDKRSNSSKLGRTSPILSYFCVYNPSLGQSEENNKDQILYYTAKKVVPADVKLKQVGLAQALVNFTSAFSTSKPTQNVHTQKNRMVFLQPEPGFWMHMCVELGILRRQIKDAKGKEKLVTEYLDTQLNDQALEAILKIGYEQFKLLNGTFSSILYGEDLDVPSQPSRQRARSLMHAIEEFFSDWIWRWDFDRLDTMVFSAVFNAVPVQPVLRSNYLRIHDLDRAINEHFDRAIDHTLILDTKEGGLVYRSPSLDITDVRSLRKFICKRVERSIAHDEEIERQRLENIQLTAKKDKTFGLKSFTKSLSQTHILNYFTSSVKPEIPPASAPTSSASSTQSNQTVSAPNEISTDFASSADPDLTDTGPRHGKYLTGLTESVIIDMNGDEQTVSRIDIVRVYLSSRSALDEKGEDISPYHYKEKLTEYFLLIYKHKSDFVWSFMLPTFAPEAEDLVADQTFYPRLEEYMIEQQLDSITEDITKNMISVEEKCLDFGKHFKCFYYDNTTLNMKTTLVDKNGRVMARAIKNSKDGKLIGGIHMTNEMLLQLLELKDDFARLPRTNEIYTRSTSNYWIAGHRLYNKLTASKESTQQEEDECSPTVADTEEDGSCSSFESLEDSRADDYTEIYIVAAKKDTSLADVEDTLHKMTTSLLETMHLE
ncbi:vacuolar fusion protein ccz1 [Apophysomyces ossiformis]|uniref:Vacuolar fusion protein ccz1 n=1 Tax=Apophysomyces ossiformis TaxID=679940 RepID=A0A8H7EMQ9_9FUNG|nr:vacuolar fusion protein ccz1 [Apophysomyces ossiformis]